MKRKWKVAAIIIAVVIVLSMVFNVSVLLTPNEKKWGMSANIVALETVSEEYLNYLSKFEYSNAVDNITVNSTNAVNAASGITDDTYGTVYEMNKNEGIEFKFNVATGTLPNVCSNS